MQFTTRWILLVAVSFGASSQLANAITRRHDVDDQVYIDLASNDLYEAVGLWQAPGACGWSGATLIHPQWAITAAHCTPGSDATPTFKLGASENDFYLQADPDNWFRNPDYAGGNQIVNGHDFGLIHFPTPILDVTPAKLYRDVFEVDNEATVVGYGRTGTGLTGEDTGLGIGVKRAATNWIDGRGGQVGWTVNVIVGDFDHPTSNVGNLPIGPSTATEFEGMIAFYDSGGAWFIEDDGQLNLAAVTSFRANTDEAPDSDYGDVFGSSRITRDQAWIDSNNAASYFWTNTTGTWSTASSWDGGSVPSATNTAVVTAGTVGINTPASTEFLFIDRSGTVQLNSTLQSSLVLLKRGGILEVGSTLPLSARITGALQQEANGVLKVGIHSDTARGQLLISEAAELAGDISVEYQAGYAGPGRGEFHIHEVLSADSIDGAFTSINGEDITDGTYTYLGENAAGEDGVFRALMYDGDSVSLVDYLAVPGDANGDGVIEITDFNIWNMYKFTSGTDWTTGDFNGDGVTDTSDFNMWNERKFTTISLPQPIPPSPIAPVPEPSSHVLAVFSCLSLLAIGRKRKTS